MCPHTKSATVLIMHALVHVHCCLVPTATGSVTLTCLKNDGWPTGPSFDIKVAAQVVDGPCTDDGDFTSTVTLNSKPTVEVTGGDNQNICSATSVTINYGATVVPTFTPDWSFVVDGEQKDNVHCTSSGKVQPWSTTSQQTCTCLQSTSSIQDNHCFPRAVLRVFTCHTCPKDGPGLRIATCS
jgi:hypothetical protein